MEPVCGRGGEMAAQSEKKKRARTGARLEFHSGDAHSRVLSAPR